MANPTITHSYAHEPENGEAPKKLVILLHGLGANGRDLLGLAPLWAQALPGAVFVSPDAPFACDMVPPGYPESYQWFSLQDRDPDLILRGVETAAPLLEAFIEEQLAKYGLGYGDLALTGFSQGTMMSLYVGPRLKEKIAGILGYSGALVGGEGFLQDPEEFHAPPVHLIHGEADDVVPVQAWQAAKTVLEQAGFEVSGYTVAGLAHSIDEPGVESGGTFLRSVFAS